MGCSLSLSEEAKRSRQIGKELRRDFSDAARIIKLLLLGAGESGKSTVVKQMKLLHVVNDRSEAGFSESERAEAQKAIYANVLDSIWALLEALDRLGIALENNKLREDRDKLVAFLDVHRQSELCPPEDVVACITSLWKCDALQKCYGRRNEFQLNDSAAYFLDDVHRVCQENFTPTDKDILNSRVKTTGIVKIEFVLKEYTFHMFDVGGQRSERKKWIHCFDNVTAVLFIVSISEFDQVLFEDGVTNRMMESLKLFESIVNNPFFESMPFIVFFNKKDLFEEKIKNKSLCLAFPDYQGNNTFEDASEFIINTYLGKSKKKEKERSIYPHLTTATDTQLVERVFTNVSQIIINDILKDIGLN